jgi:23S rRNA (uracil1939-C5)-methyltransferase
MIDQALALLDLQPTDQVLDLFCGLGNFTLPIARFAQSVYGVEGEEAIVKKALANARRQGILHVEFEAANLFADVSRKRFMQGKYHKILLDPPRSGAEYMIRELGHFQAHRIVYVSCNPATFARDAGILVNELAYTLECVGVMDMFPHTAHVESIALFKK